MISKWKTEDSHVTNLVIASKQCLRHVYKPNVWFYTIFFKLHRFWPRNGRSWRHKTTISNKWADLLCQRKLRFVCDRHWKFAAPVARFLGARGPGKRGGFTPPPPPPQRVAGFGLNIIKTQLCKQQYYYYALRQSVKIVYYKTAKHLPHLSHDTMVIM